MPRVTGGRSERKAGLAPQEIVDEVGAMMRRLNEWHLHELETSSTEEIRILACGMARKLLGTATALFERVLQSTQSSEPDPVDFLDDETDLFLEQVDRTVEAFATSASADIAFIAKLEMQSLGRELDAITPAWDGWKVIELCERIRRHIVKATTALRRTLGQEMAFVLPGDEIYVTELARSIRVRRRLGVFRRRVIETEHTHGRAMDLRLRLVGTNIAMLICRSEYRDFRIGDRVLLRDIQRTILAYLRDAERSYQGGDRIWHDVLGALEISRQINRRPELLEHDHLMLGSLAQSLRDRTYDDDSQLVERAQAVFGRDDALDELILEGGPIDRDRWLAAIEAALQMLDQHKAPDSAIEEIREASSRSGVWARVVV
ncbi:MAG: hypothetical protein KDK70_12085 [Myxococcales bacterium]|nr:hypothetical protein [Myxococcales bacterium]